MLHDIRSVPPVTSLGGGGGVNLATLHQNPLEPEPESNAGNPQQWGEPLLLRNHNYYILIRTNTYEITHGARVSFRDVHCSNASSTALSALEESSNDFGGGGGLHGWNPVATQRREAAHTWRYFKFMIFIIIKCSSLTQTSLCYLCQKIVPTKLCLPELKYCSQSHNLYKKVRIYKNVCTVHTAFLSDLK